MPVLTTEVDRFCALASLYYVAGDEERAHRAVEMVVESFKIEEDEQPCACA